MGGFGDYAFIALLALLLFGPKKLPVLARQLGKLMADFRRASNEFRTQMEEELRIAEQADRQKQIAAIEPSSPPSPPIDTESNPHLPPPPPSFTSVSAPAASSATPDSTAADTPAELASEPLLIATSGDLSIMPPSTGLPVARSQPEPEPAAAHDPAPALHESELETETLHG